MKKWAICVYVLFSLPLSMLGAQALEDRVIFVPNIVGEGQEGDAQFVAGMIRMDVPARGFGLGANFAESQYSISGTLAVWDNEWAEEGDPVMYVLHLSLIDNIEERIMVEEELYYTTTLDLSEWLRVILFTMLSNIPLPELGTRVAEDPWRYKWLYLGATVDWDNRRYINGPYTSVRDGVAGRLFVEFHFLDFASLEGGMGLARDQPVYDGAEHVALTLEGFGLLKVVFKPFNYFMLEPYGGVIFNFQISPIVTVPPLAWAAGFQAGLRMGPGLFVVDTRFALDLGLSSIGTEIEFARQLVRVGLGYKFGFFDRVKKEETKKQKASKKKKTGAKDTEQGTEKGSNAEEGSNKESNIDGAEEVTSDTTGLPDEGIAPGTENE